MARLAWGLATAADDRTRDPDQAVRLAERAAALTARQDAEALDALAAAYASAGRFDRALQVIEEALRVSGAAPMAAGLRERQELYKKGEAYRSGSRR
jgi:Flp pilus assembly protein TadD